MRVLITLGPTYERIDPVRYLGNRSSGKMGAALASAALSADHAVTLIAGPVTVLLPADARKIDVETAAEMRQTVLREFPSHDLLIMAAAVSDYRPKRVRAEKLARGADLVIELEPTEDIVAEAARSRRPDQRIIGFSLESTGGAFRAAEKLTQKRLDLIVYNPAATMESEDVEATLLWPDGRSETLAARTKADFSEILLRRAQELFHGTARY
jgi:phosphopantothenoylcysteine decarboxylase/phosphopantothenate--cysteine ligase